MLDLIKNMVLEAKSHHNDGWVMKGYKDELREIYLYLQKTFPDFTSLMSKKENNKKEESSSGKEKEKTR